MMQIFHIEFCENKMECWVSGSGGSLTVDRGHTMVTFSWNSVGRVRLGRLKAVALHTALLTLGGHAAAHAAECDDLTKLALPHAEVTSAKVIQGGVFSEAVRPGQQPRLHSGLPAFCQVQGISRPVKGSRIGFEVWLPVASSWSQRLHMVGNGAYGSNIYYAQMASRLRNGDIAVATDTGHTGGDLSFGTDNLVAINDWGNRAVHESVVAAKAVGVAYYGKPTLHNYFSGSSTGGHEALMVAQRHPEDFDGIIAGAPGNNRTHLNLQFLWQFQQNHAPGDNSRQIVPNEKLEVVYKAVTQACDSIDGVVDGVINDPRQCRFELQTLACKGDETPDCLTPAQIKTMAAIYQGPRDLRDGKQLYPGFPFGSEGVKDRPDTRRPGWSDFWADPGKPEQPQRVDFFRHWVFHDANWDWWSFNWGSDIDTVSKAMGPAINATDPDLSKFRARGGKLIMFMGWYDPVGAAAEAINYYDSVTALSASPTAAEKLKDTQTFARLYLIPGMAHTAGGPGATNVSTATRDSDPPVSDAKHDMAVALQDWVEKGVAPEALIGTKFKTGSGPTGTVDFQRPLCVYPQVSQYRRGDTRLATSFRCVSPTN
jgi:feruloyl esterase